MTKHWHLDYRDKPVAHVHRYPYEGHQHLPSASYPGGYTGSWLTKAGAEAEAKRRREAS